jgi:protein-tyrosine phosphatase
VIDLHTHLLPGIDDGSDSTERSVKVLKRMAGLGVTAVACTPHVSASTLEADPEEPLGRRERAYQELRAYAPHAPQLHLGFEIMLDQPLPALVTGDRRLSLAGSRYYLVEFSLGVVADFAGTVLELISRAGVVPLVAHPERYDACSPPVIQAWREAGARMAVDATTITRPTRRGHRARELLEAGLADVLASDNHGGRRTLATGGDYLREMGYATVADRLTRDNPRAVLEDGALTDVPEVKIEESVLRRLRRAFE